MEVHVRIIGAVLLLLAVIHVGFPRYFDWAENLRSLSLINRQMMKVHTLFIALVVLLMGLLCITSSYDLVHTPLGQRISLGLGIFWSIRLVIQLFGYSSELWKGKLFETTVHILFSLLWVYLSATFILTYLNLM